MTAPRPLRLRIYDRMTALVGGMVSVVSPFRAVRYRMHRDAYRGYLAGTTLDADRNFRPRLRSADADVKKAWPLTAARCRDQYQNNSLISGGVERICNNVVRAGIYPTFLFRHPAGDKKGKLNREVNAAWGKLFDRWSRYCDATGHDSYGALQILGLKHMWFDGGYLIHRVYDDSLPGIVPLRLELLEYAQLDTLVDGVLTSGNTARRGIEFDSRGREIAYHILDHHPGDYLPTAKRATSRRIPASEIIHVWDRDMISQYSGIPWLHAVVMEAYRMDEFRHYTQDTARAQAVYAYFLKSSVPGFTIGAGIPAGGQVAPFTPAATGAKAGSELTINSPKIQPMPSGTEIQAIGPTHPGNNYEPFVKDSQRWQSAGLGMSFEAYANNYTDASYASSRSGSLEERISYQGMQQFIEEKTNQRVIAWFIEAAWWSGLNPVSMPGYAADPLPWHELATGQMPGWLWVDPSNDATAAEKLIALGLDNKTNQCARQGLVFEDVHERRKEELELDLEIALLKKAIAEAETPASKPTKGDTDDTAE